jgi:pimeloyl-ACP methyl ester carboxylesterase
MAKMMWLLCGTAGLLAASPALAQTAKAPACPAVGTHEAPWIGLRELQGGKGYAETPMGSVHYRLVGAGTGGGGGPVLLLLHQTPWSMIEFAEIQNCLAEKGVRSLAVDTPGYGLSDAPQGSPSIAQYADNLVPVLDHLHIGRVVVAGHHTGSAIAAAFAARHPDRTAGMIMHGTPLYSPEERAQRLGAPEKPRVIKDDGSHLADYYQYIRDYAGPDPRTRVTAMWSTFAWYESAANDIAHDTVFRNDMGADLARVKAPVLVLSDAKDTLHVNDERAAKQYGFAYVQFSDGGAHAMMIDPARWAGIAADFVAKTR